MKNIKTIIFPVFLLALTLCGCKKADKVYIYDRPSAIKEDELHIFYSLLDDRDKALYMLFYDLALSPDETVKVLRIGSDELKAFTMDHLWSVYYAMCYDHPELFYLLSDGKPHINAMRETNGSDEIITFSMTDLPPDKDSLSHRFEEAASDMLEGITPDLTDSEKELLIHDRLIDRTSFDHELFSDTGSITYDDPGYTAYGAIVAGGDGSGERAVCSGYAFAFECLCQRAGIPCGYITGIADNDLTDNEEGLYHAWNIVCLDGKYYEVDCTWDDFDPYEKTDDANVISEILNDERAFDAVTHTFYNLTTADMEHLYPQKATEFTLKGRPPYNPRSASSHLRGTYELGKTDKYSMFLNSLLPVAE